MFTFFGLISEERRKIATMITISFEKILLIFKIRFTRTNQIPYCLYIPLWFLLVMIILFFFNNDLSLKKPKQLVFKIFKMRRLNFLQIYLKTDG